MLLVGSRAAHARGHLPTWRRGRMVDHDIQATELEIQNVYELWGPNDYRHTPLGVDMIKDGEVFCFRYPSNITQVLLECSDNLLIEHHGLSVLAISLESQLALKLGYVRMCHHHYDKNWADISEWIEKTEGLKTEHVKVFDEMWSRAFELFKGPEKSGNERTIVNLLSR